MIYDFFIFGGTDLDILEIRLKYLYPAVGKFVICESNKTFSGVDKPYLIEENWERFVKWEDKIVYLPIEQDPSQFKFKKVNKYDGNNGPFLMEAQQRAGLMHANYMVKDDDICILSDVDEIWNKSRIDSSIPPSEPCALGMDFYGYYVNNKNTEGPDVYWNGSVICSGKHWKSTTPQQIRDNRNHYWSLHGYGWHFSWTGNIKKKIQSFAHIEFDRPEIVDDQAIQAAVEAGGDVLQRPGVKYSPVSMSTFPVGLRAVLEQYPHLIKQYA